MTLCITTSLVLVWCIMCVCVHSERKFSPPHHTNYSSSSGSSKQTVENTARRYGFLFFRLSGNIGLKRSFHSILILSKHATSPLLPSVFSSSSSSEELSFIQLRHHFFFSSHQYVVVVVVVKLTKCNTIESPFPL